MMADRRYRQLARQAAHRYDEAGERKHIGARVLTGVPEGAAPRINREQTDGKQ